MALYLADIYTVAVNLAELPALSHPVGDLRPVGLQLIGPAFAGRALLNAAHRFQLATDWHRRGAAGLRVRERQGMKRDRR